MIDKVFKAQGTLILVVFACTIRVGVPRALTTLETLETSETLETLETLILLNSISN